MSKSRKKAPEVTGATFEMLGAMPAEVVAHQPQGDALDGLLEDLSVPGDEVEEVIEAEAGPVDHSDEILEEVESDADKIVAMQEVYEGQGKDEVEVEGDAPTTQPEVAAKGKRAKLTDEEKAARKAARDEARAEAKAKRDAERAAKPPRPTSHTHQPGDLLVAKLGAGWREFVVFTDATAGDASALEREQNAFIERMNDREAIAGKVREKIIMLFGWLKGGGELNEVMKRAFTVLFEKGELTSGDKGNLQQNLLGKPYSLGTARSQANQMFMAFPELQLTIKEKGRMVANPSSLLLPLIYDRLGLGGGAVEASGAPEVEETVEA